MEEVAVGRVGRVRRGDVGEAHGPPRALGGERALAGRVGERVARAHVARAEDLVKKVPRRPAAAMPGNEASDLPTSPTAAVPKRTASAAALGAASRRSSWVCSWPALR